jgi:glucose dehydrogenase
MPETSSGGDKMRAFGAVSLVRKAAGLALAVAGIAVIINTLPGYLWILLLGFGLIWAGWLVFRAERIS